MNWHFRLQATGDPFEARRVYEEVLALRGGAPGGDEAHAPLLRLRLLRSTLAVLRNAAVRCFTRYSIAAGQLLPPFSTGQACGSELDACA